MAARTIPPTLPRAPRKPGDHPEVVALRAAWADTPKWVLWEAAMNLATNHTDGRDTVMGTSRAASRLLREIKAVENEHGRG